MYYDSCLTKNAKCKYHFLMIPTNLHNKFSFRTHTICNIEIPAIKVQRIDNLIKDANKGFSLNRTT